MMPKFQIGSIQREQKDKIGFLEEGSRGQGEGLMKDKDSIQVKPCSQNNGNK